MGSDPFPGSDSDGTDRIVRTKLSDQVYFRLREMIASGDLKPGDAMPSERDLMERFGVGRPAVREALQSMHTLGLITISHGERSRVNTLSAGIVLAQVDEIARLFLSAEPTNLESLKEARRLFETGVVRIAAAKATADDLTELRQIVQTQTDCKTDPAGFVQADMQFHAKIAAMTGNPIIAAVSLALLKALFQYHNALLHWSGKEDVTLAEHDHIIAVIATRDGDAAVKAMLAHLDRSAALYSHS